jgi:DNA-binding response OmpR family regulator
MLNDLMLLLPKMVWNLKSSRKILMIYVFWMMMPYKDGYTLAKEIREKNSEVPIILLQNR